MSPVRLGGSVEADTLQPLGEYAQSALGRERMYEHFSRAHGIPMVLLRLNYATEMRYGVLVDVARKVLLGETVDVTMGHLNAVWQGDANAMTLCAFDHAASPALVLNVSGPEILSVRRLAEEFGKLFERPVHLQGQESADAFLTNSQASQRLFGYPRVPAEQMIHWIADWVRRGGANLGKPTHFEVRTGKY
jgi:nucleoside-diphosphate-sugar epimerase